MKEFVDNIAQQQDWRALSTMVGWVVDQATAVQQIPAPTFDEARRAAYVREQFQALGLADLDIDAVHNVYGRLHGADGSAPALMISAHTDTVFPAHTDLTLHRADAVISGPGLGDNSMGVAGLLGLARWLHTQRITPPVDLWFVAPSREEGLGDLGGMRAAYDRLKDRVALVINLEGLAFGHIYHAGIAVRRLHITATAEGGHSWLHFGRPSAIHGIVKLGGRIMQITPPLKPRTTYNIGIIEGGTSINTIAASASLWLDMRSEEQHTLETLEREVRGQIKALQSRDLRYEIVVVGDRPAGQIARTHPLVKGALAALETVQVRGTLERGSTDGNIPLAAGCPTVTIGVTRGGNAHRLDEFVEVEPIRSGMQQLITLVLAAADYTARR